jgi:hypothetical protein
MGDNKAVEVWFQNAIFYKVTQIGLGLCYYQTGIREVKQFNPASEGYLQLFFIWGGGEVGSVYFKQVWSGEPHV